MDDQSGVTASTAPTELELLKHRVDLLEKAIKTMAFWLVQSQSGFGLQDAEGIERIINGEVRVNDIAK